MKPSSDMYLSASNAHKLVPPITNRRLATNPPITPTNISTAFPNRKIDDMSDIFVVDRAQYEAMTNYSH